MPHDRPTASAQKIDLAGYIAIRFAFGATMGKVCKSMQAMVRLHFRGDGSLPNSVDKWPELDGANGSYEQASGLDVVPKCREAGFRGRRRKMCENRECEHQIEFLVADRQFSRNPL